MSTFSRLLKLSRPADPEEETLERLRRQVRQDPRSLQFVPLADLCRKRALFEEAVSVCLQGLVHHPTYVSGLVALARTYQEAGDRANAVEVYLRVVELAPGNLVGQLGLGELYEQLGQLPQAREHLVVAQQLGASSPELMARIGRLEQLLPESVPHLEAGPASLLDRRTSRRQRLLREKKAMLEAWAGRFQRQQTP